MLAMSEALSDVIGQGVAPSDFDLEFTMRVEQPKMDVFCTFTFPCPATATPEHVKQSMSQITAAAFKKVLDSKAAKFGAKPSEFTASAFLDTAILQMAETP